MLEVAPEQAPAVTRDEALALLQSYRQGDDKDWYPILVRVRWIFASASEADQAVLNDVIRGWLTSEEPKERFDAAWLTDELRIGANLDLVRKLRDEAEDRDDPAAPYEWSKFNEIAGRLTPDA